jgi:hypothetical protein
MAKEQGAQKDGPTAVGLMALHDRSFFERLLSEPEEAMRQAVADNKLSLTPDDIEVVARLIRERNARFSREDALKGWDRHRQSGEWENNDWPAAWIRW